MQSLILNTMTVQNIQKKFDNDQSPKMIPRDSGHYWEQRGSKRWHIANHVCRYKDANAFLCIEVDSNEESNNFQANIPYYILF